jgi:hypothetical protein
MARGGAEGGHPVMFRLGIGLVLLQGKRGWVLPSRPSVQIHID